MRRQVEEREDLSQSGGVQARVSETWRLLAEQLEPRVEGLTRQVEGMRRAPSYVWVSEHDALSDPAEELRVKVEALRWMLRIGKRLSGESREMVMATVARSLEELERAVDARAHADVVKVAA